MGLLDALANSNLGGFGGLLNGIYMPSQLQPGQMQYDQMGNPIGATQQAQNNFSLPDLPQPTAQPGPSQMTAQAPVFGMGPSGFGSASPAGMPMPSQIAQPAPETVQPQQPPTDISSQSVQPTRSIDIGGYSMPQFGNAAPQQQIPQAAQPAQYPSQQPQPSGMFGQSDQSLGDKLSAGFQSFANSGALFPSIAAGITGQRTDAVGMQQQTLKATFDSLVSSGVPKNIAMAAALNPKILEQIAPQYFGKNELVDGGADPLTGQKRFLWKNNADQTLVPANPAGGASSGGSLDALQKAQAAGVTGAALYDHLPQGMGAAVRAMIEGRQPLPSPQAMRNPATLALIDAAHAIDPTFDATSWASRQAGMKDFTSGKSSEMVRAANQTLAHVGSLLDSMDALKNGSIPALNAVGNFASEQTGDGRQGSFRTNAHAVAEEMSKVFKGANLSDAEIRQWEQNLTENMSPAQQKAQVAKLSELLHGSLHALEEKRIASIGPMAAEKAGPVIKAEGQKTLDRIDAWVKSTGGNSATQSALPSGWSVKVR